MTSDPRDANPRVEALLDAWSRATARTPPEISLPVRSSQVTPFRILAVLLAILLALAGLVAAGSLLKNADGYLQSVASCADGDWPATAVSCEAAERSFQVGTVQIDRRRIWLTTLGDIKVAVPPQLQVSPNLSDATPVWVFVFDGSRSGFSYQGANGQPAWTGASTRWIHVANATEPATVAGRFVYDSGWGQLGNPPLPGALPRPHLPATADLEPASPSDLAARAIRNLGTTRSVGYELTVGYHQADFNFVALHSTGTIDFEHQRLAADADGGVTDWSMFFFGGPTSGSAVVANGLFIRDQGGVWERIPDGTVPTDQLLSASARSTALDNALAKSTIGTMVRFAPCGTNACQVVEVTLAPAALSGFLADLTGTAPPTMAGDVSDVTGELFIDPATGFPRRVDGTFNAGDTTWLVTISLEPLERAPEIVAPIP